MYNLVIVMGKSEQGPRGDPPLGRDIFDVLGKDQAFIQKLATLGKTSVSKTPVEQPAKKGVFAAIEHDAHLAGLIDGFEVGTPSVSIVSAEADAIIDPFNPYKFEIAASHIPVKTEQELNDVEHAIINFDNNRIYLTKAYLRNEGIRADMLNKAEIGYILRYIQDVSYMKGFYRDLCDDASSLSGEDFARISELFGFAQADLAELEDMHDNKDELLKQDGLLLKWKKRKQLRDFVEKSYEIKSRQNGEIR